MKTRSTLTGAKHTPAEYDAAKTEPVVLVPQVSAAWKAPQFVWQVRRELGQILCPDTPTDCPKVDTGGYQVITTLDWNDAEDRREVGLRRGPGPERQEPDARSSPAARSRRRRGPGSSACAATTSTTRRPPSIDYRTGEVLAYVGSASYTSKGNKKFQPQFDVLADGWRQPGSAIKPIDYADRHRRRDADRVDDAHGRHHQLRRQLHPDPGRQARARPGPPPLGAPVLAQHPGHQGRRS